MNIKDTKIEYAIIHYVQPTGPDKAKTLKLLFKEYTIDFNLNYLLIMAHDESEFKVIPYHNIESVDMFEKRDTSMAPDIYSPQLTQYLVQVAQWNVQTYELFEKIIDETHGLINKTQLQEMLKLGIIQNNDTLTLLTSKPKESIIN